MKSYFEIIRWKNLLFLAIIQWLMQHAVVYPLLQTYGFETESFNLYFLLMIAATILITAGGYVINDYFDVKIDRINKPDKVIVGEKISLRGSMLYYQLLTGLGTATGVLLSLWVKSFTLGFIFLMTPGLLWFYSASYKRQFLVGNLIVSLSSALSILIFAILAVAVLGTFYSKSLLQQTPIPGQIYAWIGGFSGFAFLLTWIREIIKDMEDIEGDREMESRTMPIKWGVSRTKILLYVLILITLGAIFSALFGWIEFEGNISFRYALFTIILPLLILAIFIFRAKTKEDFSQASALSKLIMLAGVLYALMFYYLTAKTYGIPLFGIFTVN